MSILRAGKIRLIHKGMSVADAAMNALGRRGQVKHSITRKAFTANIPRPLLEIGPGDRPVFSGEGVFYFDALGQEGLIRRAEADPTLDPETCPFVHYVSPDSDLGIVDRRFRAVFSSHAIEHQPDLIGHLRGVARLLELGGSYYLIIPDKRYCFDHFRPESTLHDVLEAQGRTRHTEAKIREHYARMTHNEAMDHWRGRHGKEQHQREAMEAALAAAAAGKYTDVHAWQFTPASFARIIPDLDTGLRLDRVHDTKVGDIEFMAILGRNARY
jgi:hypothetical protein